MKKIISSLFLLFTIICNSQTQTTTLDTDDIDLVRVDLTGFQYRIYYYDNAGHFKVYTKPFERNYKYVHKRIKYWNFSAMTIPVKIRPALSDMKSTAKADLKNIGLHIGVWNKIWRVYLQDGTVNEYKVSFGTLFAPAAEEFNSTNTGGVITTATTQPVLSNAFTIVLSYRGINFAIIPVGVDIGFTGEAKDWKYNGKYWFGMGLGIDSKLIGF